MFSTTWQSTLYIKYSVSLFWHTRQSAHKVNLNHYTDYSVYLFLTTWQSTVSECSVSKSKLSKQSGLWLNPDWVHRVVCEVIQTEYTEWSVRPSKLSIQSGLWGQPNWVYRVVCEPIQAEYAESSVRPSKLITQSGLWDHPNSLTRVVRNIEYSVLCTCFEMSQTEWSVRC